MGTAWYVLEVISDGRAVDFLSRSGYTVEEPLYTRHSIHKRSKARIEKTLRLLPGYLFISLPDFGVADWRQVLSTPGVIGALGVENVPEPLTPGVVEQLMFECRMGRFDQRITAPVKAQPRIKLAGFQDLRKHLAGLFTAVSVPLLA